MFGGSNYPNTGSAGFLLANGADIEDRAEDGSTPLHWAAWFSSASAVVKLLLDHGADIEARNGWGSTPLHRAAENSETSAVVELLLDHGADGAVQNKSGDTPFDLIRKNEVLKDTRAYWRLTEAQYR
ncbi:MAG: ankyrin repeat domain-containing protein [Parvularculales bacterium]